MASPCWASASLSPGSSVSSSIFPTHERPVLEPRPHRNAAQAPTRYQSRVPTGTRHKPRPAIRAASPPERGTGPDPLSEPRPHPERGTGPDPLSEPLLQFSLSGFVAGLSQQREHVFFVLFHTGLVERIHPQKVS